MNQLTTFVFQLEISSLNDLALSNIPSQSVTLATFQAPMPAPVNELAPLNMSHICTSDAVFMVHPPRLALNWFVLYGILPKLSSSAYSESAKTPLKPTTFDTSHELIGGMA